MTALQQRDTLNFARDSSRAKADRHRAPRLTQRHLGLSQMQSHSALGPCRSCVSSPEHNPVSGTRGPERPPPSMGRCVNRLYGAFYFRECGYPSRTPPHTVSRTPPELPRRSPELPRRSPNAPPALPATPGHSPELLGAPPALPNALRSSPGAPRRSPSVPWSSPGAPPALP